MEYKHDSYISPFTWRYASEEMKSIFSEVHKRKLLRRVWIALARAEMEAGIVTKEQLEDLENHKDDIDIERASEIESTIHHDLMAEIKTYAEQCKKGGAIIHLGATSMDALDNADAIRFKEALTLTRERLSTLIDQLCIKAEKYKEIPTMAFTHIQPAEITTVGYRLSQTIQDLNSDLTDLFNLENNIKGKGMKGAVGTGASYSALLEGTKLTSIELDQMVAKELGIEVFEAATQTYTRKQDLKIMEVLSSIAATLHKFSLDFRILQSPPIGEFSEPFGVHQVGSSAMPFKRNPINSEKIDSLCRIITSFYESAWINASSTILERSLDDSANRRIFIPESFLAIDEILTTEIKIVRNMNVHEKATEKLMENYGIFSATERLLMELGKRGADRQAFHEVIRTESLSSWQKVQSGEDNDLKMRLMNNKSISEFLSKAEVESLLDASSYIGDAVQRTENVINQTRRNPALKIR